MLTKDHRRLLILLGAATLFDGYDRSIVTLALPYIGKDLGASEATLGFSLSLIRIGAFVAGICGILADRFGRRGVLLATVVAYTVATVATGVSRTIPEFILCQFVATIFLTAEVVLANVVIAEEFPAEARATGIGVLGAVGAIGSSCAAVIFPWLQASQFGWRGLYLVGAVPLVIVAVARRSLGETGRWQRIDRSRAGRLRDLLRPGLRGRFALVACVLAAAMMTEVPGFNFASYRATNTFGWSPGAVSLLVITASLSGFFGWLIGGRISDRLGRRLAASAGLIAGGAGQIAFYTTPWLLPAIAVAICGNATAMTVIYTYSTELFPTELRATARAWIGYIGVTGGTAGLALVGAGTRLLGGSAPVLAALAAGNFLAATAILASLPETRAKDLDLIATLPTEP